jgi:lipid II:glycine glycyltransferase (peptidoglycan interpeptide bridge formation enzyme)
MIIREITSSDRQRFNRQASHPLQSFDWGEFRKLTGAKIVRKGIFKEKKLVMPVQVTIHPIPKVSWKVGYFPKGPMPDEIQLKVLEEIGKEHKCLIIKMEPNIGAVIKEGQPKMQAWGTIDEFLLNRGCKRGRPLFTKYTFQLNLTKSEADLMKKMHHKTRYNVRLAERKGVKVTVDNSKASFDWFLKLLFEQTVSRQGFYAHTPDYFKNLWQVLKPTGMAHLLRASYKDKVLAVFMCLVFNKKIYYPYGASTREYKELMAPNLLMWELIKFGKKQGCERLDMWGALGPKPNKKDPWYGFHRFKQGYGGDLVEFLGTYDLVLEPRLYPLYKTADAMRWEGLRAKAQVKKIPHEVKGLSKQVRGQVSRISEAALSLFE